MSESTQTSSGILNPLFPCDRGVPGNVTSRGWHHFQVGVNGQACCIYCGQISQAGKPFTVTSMEAGNG
jgi:hypothetical protein